MTPAPNRRWLVATKVAVCVWSGIVVAAGVFGAVMSRFTGDSTELPKWNGLDYLLFSAMESVMIGAVLATPIAAVTLCIARVCTRSWDTAFGGRPLAGGRIRW
jgi:hypothetical protein